MSACCKRCRWPLLAIAFLCVSAWADQDDDDADLKPTPEENARAAILKRWPDAKEIDVTDLADEDDEDDGDKADKADKDDAEAADERADGDDADEAGDADMADGDGEFTLSVTFESGGRDFEALVDDEGKIKYVYEEIPFNQAPSEIIGAALSRVKDGDLIYFDRVLDETTGRSVQTYIVGVSDKDVYLDAEGAVTSVEDAPDDIPDDAEMPDAAEVI